MTTYIDVLTVVIWHQVEMVIFFSAHDLFVVFVQLLNRTSFKEHGSTAFQHHAKATTGAVPL